jgi:ribosomal protein S18 acetylase RimI-like enzyme
MKPDDHRGLMLLAAKSGLFSAEELTHLEGVVRTEIAFDRTLWLVTGDSELEGAVYAAPEAMSDRVWNVLMLIVDPARRGMGVGHQLMAAVEEELATTARVLLVETSEGDGLESARAFYPRCGFDEVARIPSYYGQDIAKIVFQKRLVNEETSSE